jgi:hypothetical protein
LEPFPPFRPDVPPNQIPIERSILLFEIAVVPLAEAHDVPHVAVAYVPFSRIQMFSLEDELARFGTVPSTHSRLDIVLKDASAIFSNGDLP